MTYPYYLKMSLSELVDKCGSAHFARGTRDFINVMYSDKWIGLVGGPIAWPPKSPDLTPLDFYLWGNLKSRSTPVRNCGKEFKRHAEK
ncbi:hypothetical protein Pcinc_043543 [Petrolisthes cinctipes]|uniref:Uncharacterized protein n=1 Tax=Petrolisthes cinctipes TaxID=88211 RepID=A0AAE1BIY2_PETCI|nr:hypothetical protein Pcinc_043543 [Petrolisthes cinctipes]